jgi:phosphoribosyl 1,2-cyclic phosphate phosphodiesterase
MVITFLGTGTSQGIPVIGCNCEVCRSLDFRNQRLRVSVLIQEDDKNIVIDAGPDFRQQMLRERVLKIDALLFTHEHKDHTAGLDDVRAYNFRVNGKEVSTIDEARPMPVYARNTVIEQLKKEFEYIFAEHRYPGIPQLDIHEIDNKPFHVENIEITPIEVMHLKLPVFGFRIKNFTYITDANFISAEEIEKIKGTKILVLNALQKQPHISHFNLEQAVEMIEKIKPQRAYITHISHKMGLHTSVEAELPSHIRLAYDGLKIRI